MSEEISKFTLFLLSTAIATIFVAGIAIGIGMNETFVAFVLLFGLIIAITARLLEDLRSILKELREIRTKLEEGGGD